MAYRTFLFAAVYGSLCCIGCGGGDDDSFDEVTLDPAVVAAAVMAEYDTDSNGEISKSELKKCPGLQMLTKGEEMLLPDYRLDSDESGTISEAEFTEKFRACFKDMRQAYGCQVLYRGRPLEGATVTLVPMPFMGDIFGASGETDVEGMCSVMGDDGKPGAIPGIYRVEVTHPEVKISSKYNANSTFSVALDTTNPYAQEGTPTFPVK
jgi:hypothetical protein